MEAETLDVSCVGKLPTHGDFVNHRASTPAFQAFTDWVQKGLHRARQTTGNSDGADGTVGTTKMVVSPQDTSSLLLGVMRQSQDRTGRRYPFAVASEIPKASIDTKDLTYLPLQARRFLTDAEQVVRKAVAGEIPYREVPDRIDQIDPSVSVRPSPPASYRRHLQENTMGNLMESIFGDFDDPGKYRLMKNLLDITKSVRQQATPRLNYGIRFPLGAEPASPAVLACFWLDASLRLAGHSGTSLSFFWTDPQEESTSAHLVLCVGPPKAQIVPYLLGTDDATEHVYRLEGKTSVSDSTPARALPDTYRSLVENRELPLWDVLQRL